MSVHRTALWPPISMMNNKLVTGSVIRITPCNRSTRYLSDVSDHISVPQEIRKYCRVLNVSLDFDETQLKDAYLKACKTTHPDTNTTEADSQRFTEVEDAYRKLKEHLKSSGHQKQIAKEMNGEEEEKVDFGGKVAQHRQYLSLDGIGAGTPSQRLKQYEKYRLNQASNRVNEFNLDRIRATDNWSQENALIIKDAKIQRKMKTKQGFERLVEDLIQESMAKGDFNNLTGYGKPLKNRTEYPYLDFTTFKINEILINNGFVPEWVLLEKEIRDEKNQIKRELLSLKSQSKLNNISLVRHLLADKVKEVNKMIDKYNRIVPILTKQQIQLILEKEVKKVLEANDNDYCQKVDVDSGTEKSSDLKPNNVKEKETGDNKVLSKLFSLFSQ